MSLCNAPPNVLSWRELLTQLLRLESHLLTSRPVRRFRRLLFAGIFVAGLLTGFLLAALPTADAAPGAATVIQLEDEERLLILYSPNCQAIYDQVRELQAEAGESE